MGQESKCTLTFGRATAEGNALLETDALVFRGGDVRLSVPYRDITSVAGRLDKLGIKPGAVVILLGVKDEQFAMEVAARGARVSTRLGGEADVIFLAADRRDRLEKLGPIQQHLKRDGAIWVIRPRGIDAITERDVMQAGKAAGLVDVKVARFSDTQTAEKFVIPVRRR
jgi:hypothetical protein